MTSKSKASSLTVSENLRAASIAASSAASGPVSVESEDIQDQDNSDLSSSQTSTSTETISISEDTSSSVSSAHVVLSPLEAIGIISVLETCIDQINILSYTNDKPPVEPNMEYKTLEERFGVPDEKDRVIDVETDLLREVAIDSMKLKKLQRDRAFLEKTLQATLEEIKNTGSFHVLSRTVLQEILVQMEEKELIEQEKRNSEEVKYLQAKIVEEAKEIHDKLYQRDEIIAKLKDQMQDVMFDSEMQLRYVDHWERARQNQNLLKYNLQERQLTENIEGLETQTSTEDKVSEAVERYINESQDKLLQEIDDWQHRYTTELEERQLYISKLKEQREQHFEELEELAALFQKHKEEIRDYLEFVAERERKEAERIFINKMATRIQAWWRGTMVRRGLGPYRKKKGKGKDKDKDKGKKGKKK